MADRPLIKPNLQKPLIAAGDMSGNLTSPVTNIYGPTIMSYSVVWTGNPTGTFAVQVSNDYDQAPNGTVLSAGTWNTLPSTVFVGTYPVPAGAPGNGFLDIVGTGAAWMRLVYTAGSGSGSLTVIPSGKVF